MATTALNILSRQLLLRLAGETFFARGEAYFLEERVREIKATRGVIKALVAGSEDYRVELWDGDEEIGHFCSCPLGRADAFCKHCVAAALAWMEEGPTTKTRKTRADLRKFLESHDRALLLEIILEEASDNKAFRERLVLQAARSDPERIDLSAYRKAIKKAVNPSYDVDYYHAKQYSQGIQRVTESIEALLEEGHATQTIELTEYALREIEKALGYVDDSDGYMGDIVSDLHDLHCRACDLARPDPVALARKLFDWELNNEYFSPAGAGYSEILGEDGLAEYRRLAVSEWSKLPAIDRREENPNHNSHRYRLTEIMESLARQSGDVDALVAIKQNDLSSAYNYLGIAETYARANRHDEALEWTERGWNAFPDNHDWRLREFLIAEYQRRGRHEEAMYLSWEQYAATPRLENYQKLKTDADKSGQSEWKQWRDKALDHLRAIYERRERDASKQPIPWRRDRSELVRIFLLEERQEEAWAEAQAGGCSDDLWMELAAGRESDHPLDSLSIYRQRIPRLLSTTNNQAYAEATKLIQRCQKLQMRLGQAREFDNYIVGLRLEHRRKRNFMKLLDGMK